MGVDTKQIGGGGATAVSNEFSNMLLQGLQGGFGAVPGTQTGPADAFNRPNSGLGGYLQMLLSGQGAQGLIAQANAEKENSIGDLRERFSIAGQGYGTPASVAEARYRGTVDPQIANIYSQNVMQALSQILPLYGQQVGIGTPQAQMVQTPTLGANILNGITGLAQTAGQFRAPGLSSAAQAPSFGPLANPVMLPRQTLQFSTPIPGIRY